MMPLAKAQAFKATKLREHHFLIDRLYGCIQNLFKFNKTVTYIYSLNPLLAGYILNISSQLV